jgi:Predicted transcriptional regulators
VRAWPRRSGSRTGNARCRRRSASSASGGLCSSCTTPFDGYSRFDQFQENLGISSSLLTSRLKRMVGAGLLERRQYQANPARYEYLLTELGRSLRPVVVVLAAWGNARLAPT